MTWAALHSGGMMHRLMLVVAVALAIAFTGNMMLAALHNRQILSEEKLKLVAEQMANAGHMAAQVDPGRRAGLVAGMGLTGMSINWVPRTVIADTAQAQPELARVRARLNLAAPELSRRDLRLSLVPGADGRDLLGALRLDDGSFVTFRVHPFWGSPPSLALTTLLHLVLSGAVLGATLLMIRALVRPLGDLARAADRTGKGMRAAIPVQGPGEVRRVAIAFRAMQARLLQVVDDHSQALVAVSHDLRTPIQRMKLRIASLADERSRDAMTDDLVDMEKFVASVTALIESGIDEEPRVVDLAALAMTVADNATDTGFNVDYDGPDSLPVSLKPLAMKRALGNLVDNACRCASQVRIVLRAGEMVLLTIDDNGPGIPPDRYEEAFLPFHRLDGARNGGGSGLGLTIVRNAVASIGGKVTLDRSALGGLSVRIAFANE